MKFSILTTLRTNNFDDPDIQTRLMGLWKNNEAFVQQAMEKDGTVACVYHQYDSDYRGNYSVSLCKADPVGTDFDTSIYQWKEYKVRGTSGTSVLNTWQKIWRDEEKHVINRVYDFDFETYYLNGEVTIQVAVHRRM